MVSNLTDSVHILKCGHASCTSFRSSYKPIVDNSKSNIGYGVSINLQRFNLYIYTYIFIFIINLYLYSNGNPVLSFFSKGDDVIYLTRVDCDDEFCDKYSIYHSSERKDYHSQSLSTQILFGSNNEPIIVANDGYKISSFRKVDEQFEETILFELSEVESLSFKNASNNEYLVTYVVDNHPHVGKCDINLTKCRSFTPAFLPGELGVADGVSKSDSLYSVVFASVMELDKIKSSIQFASCKGTTCDVVHDVFTETHNETLEIGVSLFRNESSFPIIRYQYGASPLTLIDCLDESCSKFNVSSIDPSKTVASRYQKRINIVWAIIILPALCLAVAIILAIWRIQRYIKDKRESYQPIS